MSIAFCEKYCPTKTTEIIGDNYATVSLHNWISKFPKCKSKCLLVTGNHGTGKSCRVDTILKDLNYAKKKFDILKFKKSVDSELYVRELTSCSSIVSLMSLENTQKCAIVIDEADTELLSQEKKQLITLTKINNKLSICPIIFVFDSKHSKLINTLRKVTDEIRINPPTESEMMDLLKKICYNEKIGIKNENVAKNIISFSQNDFRRLCTTLYDISRDVGHTSLTQEHIEKYKELMMEKNVSFDLFKTTRLLLTKFNSINDCFKLFEIEKVYVPLMLHQNYPLVINPNSTNKNYKTLVDLTKSLSYGDVIDNYVYGEQRWDITNVYGFYSCCYPSFILKKQELHGFPSFFVDMGRTSNKRLNKKHIINASRIFNSTNSFDYVYINKIFFHLITKNKMDELINIMKVYGLTISKIDDILKIDKNTPHKNIFTSRQKKILQKI
jgi:DNA polymerase III delta prime subunit